MQWRRSARPGSSARENSERRERGATIPEYALLVALFVVSSLGAINFLSAEGEEETQNQADCVAERPPRASCQVPAIITTTSSVVPSTTASTSPPGTGTTSTTGSTAPTTAPPPNEFAWSPATGPVANDDDADGYWTVDSGFAVTDADSNPVEGAVVKVRWRLPGGQTFPQQCTTAADGTCNVTFDSPFPDVDYVTVTVTDIVSDPPVADITPPGYCVPLAGSCPPTP